MRANNFGRVVRKVLAQKIPTHEWCVGWKPKGIRYENVDVGGITSEGMSILIEIELRRDDPVTNVAKIWRWKNTGKLAGDFVLFHAFSGFYDSKSDRRENAKFIGLQMQERCAGARYIPLRMRYSPRRKGQEGGDYMHRAAVKLARRIFTAWEGLGGVRNPHE